MRLIALLTSFALSVFTTHTARANDVRVVPQQKKLSPASDKTRRLAIRVLDGDWGSARPEEIEHLLAVVAEDLLSHFPERQLDPIVVSPSGDGPIVLYAKGPENAYQVRLAARDHAWAEYIYEFSHELLHILVHYERHAPPMNSRHQWFEEALCETVALHSLRNLSSTWEQSPPHTEWTEYASTLARYIELVLEEPHRKLADGVSLAEWFRKNESDLVGKPYLRDKNELVATIFLPLFEQSPSWAALAYLNSGPHDVWGRFESHLSAWHRQSPEEHKRFVEQVMAMFEFAPPER